MEPNEILRAVDPTMNQSLTQGGAGYAPSLSTPSLDRQITIAETSVVRVVTVEVEGAEQWSRLIGIEDPDTGVVTVTIGCQSHSIQRWRRSADRLVRRYLGYLDSGDRVKHVNALQDALDAIEAVFASPVDAKQQG